MIWSIMIIYWRRSTLKTDYLLIWLYYNFLLTLFYSQLINYKGKQIVIIVLQQIMSTKLGKDVIDTYEKYRNTSTKWKVTNISTQKFEIDQRYQIIDAIGQGAYAMVVAARDRQAKDKEKALVAIKKIDKAFEHKIFTKRTLRQLRLLKLLKHQNIIGVDTILLPKSREDFEQIYVVSELMETDLATIIKSEQPLTDQHIQFFLYQILRGLKYIHSASVAHRDLKPRNLLVNSNCDLKICDFGLARAIIKNQNPKANILTDYVATRWYRAPQLLLCAQQYTTSVDMWSVGCILAQMLRRKAFLPGSDTKNQIQLICEFFGTPNVDSIKSIPQQSKKLIKSLPKRQGKAFDKVFNQATPEALDLLKKLLIFDPSKRITVQEALKHPYFVNLHIEEDEPVREAINPLDFEFQQHNLTMQQLKDLLYEQILLYHYKDFYQDYENKKKNKQSLIVHILKNSNANLIDPYADNDDE